METGVPVVTYNTQLLAEDMAAQGLNKAQLAAEAHVSDMTVTRFLRGDSQTAGTAMKLAMALGFDVERYLIRQPQGGA